MTVKHVRALNLMLLLLSVGALLAFTEPAVAQTPQRMTALTTSGVK